MERTLGIIKPHIVESKRAFEILSIIEKNRDMKIVAIKKMKITADEAHVFYAEHSHKPFFPKLVERMTFGESIIFILEGNNIITRYRNLMGTTNPQESPEGTIRNMYGIDLDNNAVHGSDSGINAAKEISIFF